MTLILLCSFFDIVLAELRIELTEGIDKVIPLAITFDKKSKNFQLEDNIAKILRNDLYLSGQFDSAIDPYISREEIKTVSYFLAKDFDYLIKIRTETIDNTKIKVFIYLIDLYANMNLIKEGKLDNLSYLIKREFTMAKDELRRLAHTVSNLIYEKILGETAIFNTKITYIEKIKNKDKNLYMLKISDMDGFNAQTIVKSSEPIMSPNWSSNGEEIAYVGFFGRQAAIYIHNLKSGTKRKITNFAGINGAPAFSPDAKKLALVLSIDGSPKIYQFDLESNQLKKITTGFSADTEPCWSSQGDSIFFTSNRGGNPEIYEIELISGKITRKTFCGNYNASATISPEEKYLIFLHKADNQFGIAKMNLKDRDNECIKLTAGENAQSPSISPNGKFIVYAKNYGMRGSLAVVSLDGKIRLNLISSEGEVSEPSWSPIDF